MPIRWNCRLHFVVAFTLAGFALSGLGLAGEKAPAAEARTSNGQGGKAGTFKDEVLQVGNLERRYRLVVPDGVDLAKPTPLVFAFHGGIIDSKDLMPVYSQLDELAKKERFILVYPNASNQVGWFIVKAFAKVDLDFFDALLKRLSEQYNVDLNRVYATGMSSGGYFCHLLASERSEVVAAIAPHSCGLEGLGGKVEAKRKVPVFIVHGEVDPIIKVESGRKARDAYKDAGHEVAYWEVKNGHHVWALWQGVNERIWKFFEAHPMPESGAKTQAADSPNSKNK